MTATVLFVHGTGVRGERYLAEFGRVRANIQQRRPDVQVLPCRWGDQLGATLHAGGASVPAEAPGRKVNDEAAAEQAWRMSQWGLLELDPLHELRMIATIAQGAGGRPFVLGAEPVERLLVQRSRLLPDDPQVKEALREAGLGAVFADAIAVVLDAAAAQEAMRLAAATDVAPALGRAFIAEALRQAAAADSGPVPVIAERREELLLAVVAGLGFATLGIASSLAKSAALLAWRWAGAGVAERRRGAITDATHPMAGDIMRYLSRGEKIRGFIRDCCRDARSPVVLLAHSLGGIACLDLLATESVPQVVGLVTVGSQAPFLYELGALPSLAYGEQLPTGFPAWTNFYDPRDLLAFVGEPLFPGRIVDIAVPSGNPFPFAHSDYFGTPAFYDRLQETIP